MVSRMRRLGRAFALGLTLATLTLLGVHSAAADPTGQISNVQNMPGQVQFLYTVKGVPAGTQLDAKSLAVTLNGTPLQATSQPAGTQVGGTVAPRTAILVMDLSGSMAGARLDAARAAATTYVRSLPADVRIGLITFSDTVHTLVAPTANRAAVLTALAGVQAGGNTSLYDALAQALRTAAASTPGPQDRLLVLSDGGDNTSTVSLSAITAALRLSSVSADFVAFGLDADQAVLGSLARAGHGRMLPVRDTTALGSAFSTAAQSFSQQALITAAVPPSLAGTHGQLQVTLVLAGGQHLATGQPMSVPALVTTPSASAPVVITSAASSSFSWISTPLVLALVFAGLLGLGMLVLYRPAGSKPTTSRKHRMAQLDRYRLGTNIVTKEEVPANSVVSSVLSTTDKLLKARSNTAVVAANLDRAGLKLRPQEWLLLRISAGFVLIAGLYVLTQSLIVGAIVGVLVGWLGTKFYLKFMIKRRCSAFASQLPDTLQLIASSLRSGFSLMQALDAIVREGSEPASAEFSRALSDGRLGVNIDDALDTVAERMQCADLTWVVMAIRISREVGGNLAEVLMTTVGTMRERATVRRQVKALSAEGKLSGFILVGLPIGITAFLFLTRPDYLRPLYTDPLGWAMLVGAVISMCIGSWWMSKIVKIEV